METGKTATNGLDENGYIISDVSKEFIDDKYWPVINDVVVRFQKEFTDQIHSIYVYGSVARGNAISGKSDLDILVIFQEALTQDHKNNPERVSGDLSREYRSLLREIGIAYSTLDEVVDPKHLNGWGIFLKVFCVYVWGDEDLSRRFQKFKISPEIATGLNGDVGQSIKKALEDLRTAEDDEAIRKITSTISRKLIRTVYSMIMNRTQIWVTTTGPQALYCKQYVPTKSEDIDLVHNWIDRPSADKNEVINELQSFGNWITENFDIEVRKSA